MLLIKTAAMSDSPYSILRCKIDDIVIRASTLQTSLIEQERTINTTDKLEAVARIVLPDHGGNIGRVKKVIKGEVTVNRHLVENDVDRLITEMMKLLINTPTGRRRCDIKASQTKAYLKDLAAVSNINHASKKIARLLVLARKITAELIILDVQWKPRMVIIHGGKQVSGRLQIETLLSTEIDGYLKVCDSYCSDETLAILESVPITIPIILLTCPPNNQSRFIDFLSKMRKEGYKIDVIVVGDKKQFFHDRFIICLSRGWQIGGSLKDVGKRSMTITQLDTKKEIENLIDEFINGKLTEVSRL